ncbi:hypothetical protein B0T21DRAFT_455922 [Apiosordaria backusii]|uniref:Uncharacterized protein n=1 Tax=Apiosordaria backusii TaxID=314023 RepID=A0AA39ZPD2_9PEZI|nr:hypothetical protein B0T21DRAFT_455922 [Apiosordaria backusii]
MHRPNYRTLGRPAANTQDAPVMLQDLGARASTATPVAPDIETNPSRDATIARPTTTTTSPPSVPMVPRIMSNTRSSLAGIQSASSTPTTPSFQAGTSSSPQPLNHSSTAQTETISTTSAAPHQRLTNLSSATAVHINNPSSRNGTNRLNTWLSRISTIPPPTTFVKRIRQQLEIPTILLITLLLFIFATLVSWQAHNLDWPLARIPIPSGILLLTVVAKFTDWALASVTNDAWERLQWGPLLQRRGNLLTFLVMSSGFGAWWRVLFSSEVQPGEETRWGRMRRLVTKQGWKRRWRTGPRFWSFVRICIWFFIQFPGVILMAMIENKDSFRPSGWTTVTGGLGRFNASLGWLQPADPVQYRHVFSILQDPALTLLTEPISQPCAREKSCQSYLFSGGLELLLPWPIVPRQTTNAHAYMVKDIPSYQIDAWETSFNTSLPFGAWDEDQCRVFAIGSELYGASDSIQVCANRDGEGGRLLAGIRSCGFQALDETGNCTLEANYPGWNSFPAFTSTIELYRVTADLAFDRHSRSILDLSAKRVHTQHNVDPEDFLDAFSLILCPFIQPNTTQTSRWCTPGGINFMLTNAVYVRLTHAYSEVAFDNVEAVNILRNLFATALYLFNPVYRMTVIDRSTPIRPNETASGLPAENTFLGSPAIQSSYIAPATWTVVAFIVSAALVITAAVVAMGVSAIYEMPALNKFPAVDGMKIVVVDRTTGEETFIGNVVGRKKTAEEVLYAARRTTVRIAQRETQG